MDGGQYVRAAPVPEPAMPPYIVTVDPVGVPDVAIPPLLGRVETSAQERFHQRALPSHPVPFTPVAPSRSGRP
jgi:hypothetical protein